MSSPILSLLILTVYCHDAYSNAVSSTSKLSLLKTPETPILNKAGNHSHETDAYWKNVLFGRYKSPKTEQQKKSGNTDVDPNKRKSRILGSLAFLAGLGVGGLTGAASQTVKSYAKVPQSLLAFSVGHPRYPYFAAYYDPYPYHPYPHPYMYSNPVGFYPFLDPSRLTSAVGGPANNGFQSVSQNQLPPQVLHLFNSKRPNDAVENNDEYVEEDKKAENEKTSSDVDEKTNDSAESRLDVERNAEEEGLTRKVTCKKLKDPRKKGNDLTSDMFQNHEDLQEDADGTSASLISRQSRPRNRTSTHHHASTHSPTTHISTPLPIPTPIPGITLPLSPHPSPRPDSDVPPSTQHPLTPTPPPRNVTTSTTAAQNPGIINNHTNYPAFYGYYGGSPQDLNHIDLTTETNIVRYPDYSQINYNLPYERPANFYPDDKYNYYSNPPTNQFQQDQVPEYYSNDFNRFLYTPDNTPPFVNGFRPVL